MVEIKITEDEARNEYLLDPSQTFLGARYDNLSDEIKIIFPQREIDNESICTMIITSSSKEVDCVTVRHNEVFKLKSPMSHYRQVAIGFSFQKDDGYIKNSNIEFFYFREAQYPDEYVPIEPTQREKVNLLIGEAFVDVAWAEENSNILEFKNMDGAVIKRINIVVSVDGKLDKPTNPTRASVVTMQAVGTVGTSQLVHEAPTPWSVPCRDGDGCVAVADPKSDIHATSQGYVKKLLNGANKAVSFVNYSLMISTLNSLANTSYGVGQNIMIVTLNVPDLWVSEIAEESVAYTYVSDDDFVNELTANGSVQVGYYKLSALETQKVDLTDYATVSQVNSKVQKISYSTDQTIKDGSDGGVIGRAYIRDRENKENSIVLNCQNTKFSVPVRDANGNFYVGDPTQVYHCANKKTITALQGTEAPTESTVAQFVGQIYLDTTNNNTYECTAITTDTETRITTYTWVKLIRSTDIANNTFNGATYDGEAGLFMFDGAGKGGFFKSTAGGDGKDRFRIKKATFKEIEDRTPSTYHDAGVVSPNHCCPVTPANFDYAFKRAFLDDKLNGYVYDNVDYSWTDEQKAQARKFLGATNLNTHANYGIQNNNSGLAMIVKATDDEIKNRSTSYKPIVPANMDLAVTQALIGKATETTAEDGTVTTTYEHQVTLTDEEKASARELLGVSGGVTIKTYTPTSKADALSFIYNNFAKIHHIYLPQAMGGAITITNKKITDTTITTETNTYAPNNYIVVNSLSSSMRAISTNGDKTFELSISDNQDSTIYVKCFSEIDGEFYYGTGTMSGKIWNSIKTWKIYYFE